MLVPGESLQWPQGHGLYTFLRNGSALLLQALSKKSSTGISSVTLGGHTITPKRLHNFPKVTAWSPGLSLLAAHSREKLDMVWSGSG